MKLTPLAFILAAYTLGYALAYSPPVDPPATDPKESAEYKAKVAECDSLSFALNQALEAKGLAESKLAESQTQVDSLRVQLAAATAVKPDTGIVTQLPVSGAACPTGNCQPAYQQPATVEYYQPRRRLFGRFR